MDTLTHVPGVDDRREYRNDLLSVSAVMLSGLDRFINATDKDIESAVRLADRLIRKVDRFASVGEQKAEQPAPLQLSDIDADTE